jgi:hypothetical protein
MSRRVNFHLNEHQLGQIEYAMNHSPLPEVRQRATAMRLLHLDHSPEAVAEMLAVAPSSVWNWHRRWRSGGLNGLANISKSGRPRKADANYLRVLDQALNTEPSALGFAFALWTITGWGCLKPCGEVLSCLDVACWKAQPTPSIGMCLDPESLRQL